MPRQGRVLQSKLVELCEGGLPGVIVNLVDRQDNLFVRFAKDGCNLIVGRQDSRQTIDRKHDNIGLFDCNLHLFADSGFHNIFGFRDKASGIDKCERLPGPVRLRVVAVPGDSRKIMHNGIALSDYSVEKSGLADIRPTDYCNQPLRHQVRMLLKERRRAREII